MLGREDSITLPQAKDVTIVKRESILLEVYA
jgi:hypothetical protein